MNFFYRPRSESAVSVLSDQFLTGGNASGQSLETTDSGGPIAEDIEADYVPVDPLLITSQQQADGGGGEE